MAKWCGFTICFDPAFPWLYENLKNIASEFDQFYVIHAWVKPMVDSLESKIGHEKVQNSFVKPYASFIERIKTNPNVIITRLNMPDDKLEMCNDAYTVATETGMDFVWQVDADEFYTADTIKTIKREVERINPDIASIHESKYWKNFMPLAGGIWDSYPARIFKVIPDKRFTNHRPPALGVTTDEIKLNPSHAPTIMIPGHHMHHFCYTDPCQVMLKSIFFSTIRKNHPTYGAYDKWFLEWYQNWVPDCAYKPWKYHPASPVSTMAGPGYDAVKWYQEIENMFPLNKSFLRRYCQSFSAI